MHSLEFLSGPMRSALIMAVLVEFCSADVHALKAEADGDGDQAKARDVETLKLAKQVTAEYKFFGKTGRKTELVQKPESILRWSNPVSGSVFGEVFIWTDQGRPEVIASVYRYYSPRQFLAMELHSLSLKKIAAQRDGRQVWSPAAAGVELKPVPAAAPPFKTAVARLRQMRALANEFSVVRTDRKDQRERLRLLSQPNYRYASTDPKLLDGALFIFAQGTNPEVILLIEARRSHGGHQWQYALARQSLVRFDVLHKNQNVRTFPLLPRSAVSDRTRPYTGFYRFPDK